MSDAMAPELGGDSELRAAVAAIRSHWRRRRLIEGAPAIVAAAIIALLAGLALRSALASPGAIIMATRVVGYALLAIAAVLFLLLPFLRRINDEQIALYVEEQAPELRQLFLSAVHQLQEPDAPGASPVLRQRLIARALDEIRRLEHGSILERPKARRAYFRLAALTATGVLMVALGPSAIRDVARILFVPWSRAVAATIPALSVSPGNVSVPRGAALDVRADLRAAPDHGAEIMVRADSSGEWTRVPMVRDSTGAGYVVRLFDINRNTTYYIEAGGLRSPEYHVTVTDLPTVKELTLELRYPAYTNLPPQKIENGGDVVGVTGTTAILSVAATLPVSGGALQFDDGTTVPLALGADGRLAGSFKVMHDGFYRVDMVATDGTRVPGTVQHSVEVLLDHPPSIRIEKPGRDTRVSSIEEVPIAVRASDDYGVRGVELHYSINGGPDKTIVLTDSMHKSTIDFSAVHTIFLEELSLHVGDLVAYHATARDGAGNTASSDIYFMEIRPFGKDYHAADDNGGGGGGGGGGGNNPGKFTDRQREIVAGTFNWQRDSAKTSDRDRRANATTLAIGQGKLRTDVAAQAAQMQSRGAAGIDTVFKLVMAELDSAAKAMKPAEDGLGRHVMGDAIPAEEKALQHLQAADEAYRDITVRQQQQGGGGGGGGGGGAPQDLADLFELQTDKLKNQYETPQSSASGATPAQQAIDSAAEKLKELAARQQAENERARQAADELSRRMPSQQGGQAGQQGQQGGGQQGQSGGGRQQQNSGQQQQQNGGQQLRTQSERSQGPAGSAQRELARQVEEQARQLEKLSREQNSPELADAARKLQESADAMRQAAAGSQQQGSTALDRLRQAGENLGTAQTAAEGQAIQDLARRAGELGQQQQQIARDVAGLANASAAERDQRAAALDQRKDALTNGVQQLATDAQRVAQQTRRDQPKAAAAAQTAADEIRNRQLTDRIAASKRVMRDNMPEYSRNLESVIGETIDSVAQRLATAAGTVSGRPGQQQTVALEKTRDLVRDLQSLRDRTAGEQQQGAGEQQQQNGGAQRQQNSGSQQQQNSGAQQQQNGGAQQQRNGGQQQQQGRQGGQQQGRGEQQGQGRQGQGQQGQQGQGQQGQGQQGQPGQGQQGGQRPGQPGGDRAGGASGVASGALMPSGMGDPRQFQGEVAARRDAAEALRRDLTKQGVDVAPLDRAIDQLNQLQGATNPGKVDDLEASIVAGLKEFEFNVWRKFAGADLGNRPALGASAQVPPEYRAMVEQYYRALARKGPN